MTNLQKIARSRQSARSAILRELSKDKWSPSLISMIVSKVEEPKTYKTYEIDYLTSVAADLFQINKHLINSKSRLREVVMARNICMLYLRNYTHLSYKTIGEVFGKDHSTVLYSCKRCMIDIEINYAGLKDKYQILLENMKEG